MTPEDQERIDQIAALFRVYNPKTPEGVQAMGVKLVRIGEGAYREAYKVYGLPLIVKFPLYGNTSGKDHTRAEIKAIKTINRLKKYKILREFMPKIYYHNLRTGVVIMHQYKVLGKSKARYQYVISRLLEIITELVWPEAMKKYESVDVHAQNLGIDEEDNVVFIDLGYFFPIGKGMRDSW